MNAKKKPESESPFRDVPVISADAMQAHDELGEQIAARPRSKEVYPATAQLEADLGLLMTNKTVQDLVDVVGEYEHGVAETEDVHDGLTLQMYAAVVLDLCQTVFSAPTVEVPAKEVSYRVIHIETGNVMEPLVAISEEIAWEELAEGGDCEVEEIKTVYRLEVDPIDELVARPFGGNYGVDGLLLSELSRYYCTPTNPDEYRVRALKRADVVMGLETEDIPDDLLLEGAVAAVKELLGDDFDRMILSNG